MTPDEVTPDMVERYLLAQGRDPDIAGVDDYRPEIADAVNAVFGPDHFVEANKKVDGVPVVLSEKERLELAHAVSTLIERTCVPQHGPHAIKADERCWKTLDKLLTRTEVPREA